jgi:hypothetical protein
MHREHAELIGQLTRRSFMRRAAQVGLGAAIGATASQLPLPSPARAATPLLPDATLQAFADTIIPGRKVAKTEAGDDVHPLAIAGVDALPGAVEADAVRLYHHPESGFNALEPTFLADLQARTLQAGGEAFLELSFDKRVRVCLAGLDFQNPSREVWEAAAAVPFAAFCAATLVPEQTASKAVGYAVMGLPGRAPNGYRDFSYRRRLSRERTVAGSLPG